MAARFSIVIATYNQRDYLIETIESVLGQTHAPYEVIVVADGCTDGTPEAVRNLFPSVTLIEQPNLGKCIARNTGIAASSGDWICFLDHDDLFHRDKLATLAEFVSYHSDCVALTHPVWYFAETSAGPEEGWGFRRDFVAATLHECHEQSLNRVSPNDCSSLNTFGNSFDALLDRRLGAMSAATVRRDVLLRAGMFCPMQFNAEDWTLFVNVARLGEWGFVDQRIGFTRLHRSSGTYDIGGGLMQLACQVNAWFTGRPLRSHARGLGFLDQLEKRRYIYRFDVQKYFWSALLNRQFTLARLIRAAGQMLLTRRSDRLYVLIPPQITWRLEHFVFKRRRRRERK